MSKDIIPTATQSSVERAQNQLTKKNRLYTVNGESPKKEEIAAIVEAGYNNLVQAISRPKVDKNNLEQIKKRTLEYFSHCRDTGRLPTMEGLAVSLGIGRTTLYKWINDSSNPSLSEYLIVVRDSFSSMSAEAAMSGKINPVTWIFYSKNMYGYVDKTELTVAPANPLGEIQDPSGIQARLSAGVADD